MWTLGENVAYYKLQKNWQNPGFLTKFLLKFEFFDKRQNPLEPNCNRLKKTKKLQ